MLENEYQLNPQTEQTVVSLKSWAASLLIDSIDKRDIAIEDIKGVKTRRNEVLEFYKDMKQKAYAAHKAISSKEKSYTDILDEVEEKVKKKILNYNLEQETERLKEQARLQAAEDAKANKERERLRKEAGKLKTPELKEQRMEQAENVVAPQVVLPMAMAPKGVSTPRRWKYRVIDIRKVHIEYLIVNDKMLKGLAVATKGALKIEGIEFYHEDSLAISKRT